MFGNLSVRATSRGISEVSFGGTEPRRVGVVSPPSGLEAEAVGQIREYLDGRRRTFELLLDLSSATPFRRAVLEALLEVPFGRTVSYAEVAAQVRCASPRAVGQAVGWNPLPILVPCHRVVTKDARLGGFSGGLERKVELLRIEGILAGTADFSSPLALAG